jgi:type IV secretion system protein VirB4
MCQVRVPRHPVPLDAVLGNQEFVPGFKPRIGGRHLRVISLAGFPAFSHAELALFLAELPLAYRYSLRAIAPGLRASIGQLGLRRRLLPEAQRRGGDAQ